MSDPVKSGAQSGHPVSEETRKKLSVALTGRKNGPPIQETRDKISSSQKGKPKPYLLGHLVSAETRRKISERLSGNQNSIGHRHSVEERRKMSEIAKARGNKHNFFIDGHGDERRDERAASQTQLEYRLWRNAVFQRDNFVCQICGVRGGRLQADHVLSWKNHQDKRFDVSNGRTLCVSCHQQTPTWGNRLNEVD